ncbi:MAG TPA: hypothetical protein VJ487_09095 [Alphaproteobacteria bacterium]|nr:hypothetical protein [Alphaproteobacteria bacterium]
MRRTPSQIDQHLGDIVSQQQYVLFLDEIRARNPSLLALAFGRLRGALAETLSLHRRRAAP